MKLSTAEELMHTTVRLSCVRAGGESVTGTGFFFAFRINETTSIPVLVTNRHVVEGSQCGEFVLTKADSDGAPIFGSTERVSLANFESYWIKHPDDDVDLAIMFVFVILADLHSKGLAVFFRTLDEAQIPNSDSLDRLSGIEGITMIGYPNGIWDQRNNLPIVRRGITATNPKHDYNGLPIFLIDCACFPGSSGSPVMIFDAGSYADHTGGIAIGNRLLLMGVLYAGPQHVAPGELQTIDVPLQQRTISLSRIPNNLGFVVKIRKLLDFKPMLLELHRIATLMSSNVSTSGNSPTAPDGASISAKLS